MATTTSARTTTGTRQAAAKRTTTTRTTRARTKTLTKPPTAPPPAPIVGPTGGVSPLGQAIAKFTNLCMALLRLEARDTLLRAAEAAGGEDPASEAVRWYGLGVNAEAHQTLTLRQTALELRLEQLETTAEAAVIREDTAAIEAAQAEAQDVQAALAVVDRELWALEEATRTAISERQELLVEEEAVALYDRYLLLSQALPFNPASPAIPAWLQRWFASMAAAQAAAPAFRLFCYLVTRDTVFTHYWNTSPLDVDDVDLDALPALARPGLPTSKAEARWEALLATQFHHENGDRRIDRDTPLIQLDAARQNAVRAGERFTERFDPEADPEYAGLPTLPALTAQTLTRCRLCGGPVKDRVITRAENDEGATGWITVTRCDCTDERLTPWRASYTEALALKLALAGPLPARRRTAAPPAPGATAPTDVPMGMLDALGELEPPAAQAAAA